MRFYDRHFYGLLAVQTVTVIGLFGAFIATLP